MKLLQAGWSQRDGNRAPLTVLIVLLGFFGGVGPGVALGANIEGVVEMQPGEWNKTIPGINYFPNTEQLNATVSVPALVCEVDIVRIRGGVLDAARDGTLAAKLTQIEANPTSASATASALRLFSPGSSGQPGPRGADAKTTRFSLNGGSVNAAWSIGGNAILRADDIQLGKMERCLQLSDAQTLVLRLREVIRRYLGMPPPSAPSQELPRQGLPLPQR